jgi:hypothetical protein
LPVEYRVTNMRTPPVRVFDGGSLQIATLEHVKS